MGDKQKKPGLRDHLQKHLFILLPGCLAAVLSTALYFSSLGERFEFLVQDHWYQLRGPATAPEDLVIIAMDELSYRDLGIPLNQAWPRALHAELLQRLKEYGVKRVVFDVLFLDASGSPAADQSLAEAIGTLPVYLGAESSLREIQAGGSTHLIEEFLEPYGPFLEAAAGEGLVGFPEDWGTIRRFLTERNELAGRLPSLADVAAGVSGGAGGLPGPRDMLNYYGPAGSIKTFSYYQVLQTERPLPKEFLQDKIVLVGLVLRTELGASQKDVFQSPYGGEHIFGTEIHATAAGNILQGNWIRRAALSVEAIVLAAAAFILGAWLLAVSPLLGVLLLLAFISCWGGISYQAFLNGYFVPGAGLMLLVLPVVFMGASLFHYVVSHRAQLKVKRAFEYYLSPAMAAELSRNPDALALGGEKIEATALFTDIADFTPITERMEVEEVSAMLNAYFSDVMEAIFQERGTLIKFIGDAVFAIWGAPVKMDDHAERALRAAIAIQEAVDRFNASRRFPVLRTRAGVHSGPMVVGNLGCKQRFDYTAIGDTVNLASRIEGLNKYFGTKILFTESVRAMLSMTREHIYMGKVRVVGRQEAEPLYTIMYPALDPRTAALWREALRDFTLASFESAMGLFQQSALLDQRFVKAAELYLQTIAWFQDKGLPRDFSGEISFDQK